MGNFWRPRLASLGDIPKNQAKGEKRAVPSPLRKKLLRGEKAARHPRMLRWPRARPRMKKGTDNFLVFKKGEDVSAFRKVLDRVVGERAQISALVSTRSLEIRDLDATVEEEEVVSVLCFTLGRMVLDGSCRFWWRLLFGLPGRASEVERQELKFLQLNLGRGKDPQALLMQTARERGADVLLISEQYKWSENSSWF